MMKSKINFYIFLMLNLWLSMFCGLAYTAPQQTDSLKKAISGLPDENYKALADSWYKMATKFKSMVELDSASVYIDKYLALTLARNDSARLIKGHFLNAYLMKDKNLFNLSITECKKSLSIAVSLGDTNSMIINLNLLGNIFKDNSVFDSSAFCFREALRYSDLKGDNKKSAIILNNLGDISLATKYYQNARKYYDRSLELSSKDPMNMVQMALTNTNLGRLAGEEQNYKEASLYYDQALELYSQLNDSTGIFNIYNNYGDLYFKQGRYELAKEYFEKALKGYITIKFQKGIVTALGNMAATYLNLGNFQKAAQMHDSCINLTFRLGNMDLRMDAYWNIAETYYNTGNIEKYHEYILNYLTLKDSIYDLDKSKFIYDLNVKYEKEKDQARILTLEKENLKKTIQRNSILYSGLGLVLLVMFVALYLKLKARKDKIIAQQKIRQLEEEKKLMVAKMMIEGQEEERKRIARELHDGLGVLLSATKMQFTAIKDISPENKPLIDKAIRLLEQASGDVRKISHNMMPGLLTKLGFYEAAEDLFEKINDSGDLEATLEINGPQDRLPENREIMLYRILQEMVNNTLKYAEAGKIKLMINIMPDYLTMVYADNGKGFDVAKVLNSNSESLGLKSIQSRINFLNGESLLESKPGEGVKYSFQVPLG
jgi:two-component system, NarL family, sensor kinase